MVDVTWRDEAQRWMRRRKAQRGIKGADVKGSKAQEREQAGAERWLEWWKDREDMEGQIAQ